MLVKEVGSYVFVGTPLALIGNTGTLTTGTHLHFELWHDGKPLDPQDFMTFEDTQAAQPPEQP